MAKHRLKDRDDAKAVRPAGKKGTAGGHEKPADAVADGGAHHAAKAHGKPIRVDESLPATRSELMALHAETRSRRAGAVPGSKEHRAAIDMIARIEVRIAAIERDQVPPLV